MIGTVSPLQVIKQKELDIRQQLEDAYRQAETSVQAARAKAEQTIAQADQEGRTEAEALYQRRIEEVQQKAEGIVAAAHEEADVLRRLAMARMDEAVRRILELALPNGLPPA